MAQKEIQNVQVLEKNLHVGAKFSAQRDKKFKEKKNE